MKKALHLIILSAFQIGTSAAQTPGFEWVHTHGASLEDYGNVLVTDDLNNVYACGSFQDTVDFDPGPGVTNLSASGMTGFIQKLDANGNFLWVRTLPQSTQSIVTDAANNLIISGTFWGTSTYSTLSGNVTLSSPTNSDNFILKMNPSGDIIWIKSFGASNQNDYLSHTQVDDSGNIYSTGGFYSACDFDPGAGTSNLYSTASSLDIFVQKLTAAGDFVWAKKIGGGLNDMGTALAVRENTLFLTGWFEGDVDFDPSAATTIMNNQGDHDIYLLSLSTDGNFNWAKSFGSALGDLGNDIAITGSGEIYLTGSFKAAIDTDPGTATNLFTADDGADFFVSKLSETGNLIWARKFTGTGYKVAGSLTTLPNNGVVFTGNFDGVVDFDCGPGVNNLVSNGEADIFTVYLDQNGNYIWAGSYGNTGTGMSDASIDICADTQGNVYTIGNFFETVDFDCGTGIAERTTAGFYDVFIQKLNSNVLLVNENSLRDFKIYPNPASEKLSISVQNTDHYRAIVYDSFGRIVLQKELSGTDNQLDIQRLSPGSYVVKLTGKNGSQRQTLVKID